jgi:NAD(P)-dependent dehydrogenase (short-subunit alcohol dehydrogenase family)
VKAALVTGGSSGIGLAIARALQEDGYALTLASRTREKVEAAAAELGAEAVETDVSSESDCERLLAVHAERHGRLDVLVNSAGIGISGRLESMTAKEWELHFSVNVRGIFLVTRAALPLLKESRGYVINVSSIAGTMPSPGLGAYGASKAAVISLTRTLNAEHEADGVRATALCPAFVDTPMAAWTHIPPEQMIQPEDCAELVRALLRLSPYARMPELVVERVGTGDLDA